MYIVLAETDQSWRAMHRLYLSFVQPRPIAFVSTVSADGTANLAPFSFYNMISANPPVVVFCPAINRRGRKKDTLSNIEATGEFVIATVTEAIAEQMNICSTEFAAEISEFEESGLTPLAAKKVKRLVDGQGDEAARTEGDRTCDAARLKRVGRVGGGGYARTTDRFSLESIRHPAGLEKSQNIKKSQCQDAAEGRHAES